MKSMLTLLSTLVSLVWIQAQADCPNPTDLYLKLGQAAGPQVYSNLKDVDGHIAKGDSKEVDGHSYNMFGFIQYNENAIKLDQELPSWFKLSDAIFDGAYSSQTHTFICSYTMRGHDRKDDLLVIYLTFPSLSEQSFSVKNFSGAKPGTEKCTWLDNDSDACVDAKQKINIQCGIGQEVRLGVIELPGYPSKMDWKALEDMSTPEKCPFEIRNAQ